MFRKIRLLTYIMSCSSLVCCDKKNNTVQDNIAYQTVNITMYPNDPLNFKLGSVGGWVYVNGGVNGIIVYRKTMTTSTSDFVAIERTSTALPNNPDAKVKVQNDNFTLKDTISGTTWNIIDGSILKGTTNLNLRTYNATFDGINTLSIRN